MESKITTHVIEVFKYQSTFWVRWKLPSGKSFLLFKWEVNTKEIIDKKNKKNVFVYKEAVRVIKSLLKA